MTKQILALGVVLVIAASALANPPQCNVVQKQQVIQQFQASNYVYAQPLQLQQVYPYTHFSVAQSIQEEAMANAVAKRVFQLLQAQQNAQQGVAPQTAPTEHPGATIARMKCANCHKAGAKAVTDSQAPVMFDATGKWIGSYEAAIKAVSATKLGSMPPSPAKELETDDFITFRAWLQSLYQKETPK